MFKPKRKEKPKNGRKLSKLILLLLILLVGLSGAVAYYFFLTPQEGVDTSNIPAMAISEATPTPLPGGCTYTQGFGSREDTVLSAQIAASLQEAGFSLAEALVIEKLAEYRDCDGDVQPIYQTCSLLSVTLPIESVDPRESELGGYIAEILDVLTEEAYCQPVEISVRFETPRGAILWQMQYELALEAYEDGARGIELYDPRARR